jgi:hypothetical protein
MSIEIDAAVRSWRANDPDAGWRLALLPAAERRAVLAALGYPRPGEEIP